MKFVSKLSSSKEVSLQNISITSIRHLRYYSSSTQYTMVENGVPLHEVVQKLSEFASPSLAEDWDNVGLLVEPSSPHVVKKLFLTNDLTEDVLDEAVNLSSDFILSYHPPIFRGIKSITQAKWKDRLVVKAIENRIAIYSPHTSFDVVKGNKKKTLKAKVYDFPVDVNWFSVLDSYERKKYTPP